MSLCPVDGAVEDMRFLMVFYATVNSTCPEDVFSLLQNSNCFSLSQIMLDTFVDGVVEDRRFLTEVWMIPGGPMGHN